MPKPALVTLAHDYNPKKHDPTGWFMSEKLDGVRAYWNGKQLLSRNNKPIIAPAEWLRALPTDMQLDGELWLGRSKFQQLVSAVRKTTPISAEWRNVMYHVFDVVRDDENWFTRIQRIPMTSYPICPVMHYECISHDQLGKFYQSVVANGGEGVMLRDPTMMYERYRSWRLLKHKPECTGVARVVGHSPGDGKYVGLCGAIECKNVTGQHFAIGSGMTDAMRAEPPPIGSLVTFKCNDFTDSGLPRFPVFVSFQPPTQQQQEQ